MGKSILEKAVSLRRRNSVHVGSSRCSIAVPAIEMHTLGRGNRRRGSLPRSDSSAHIFLASRDILSLTLRAVQGKFVRKHSSTINGIQVPLRSIEGIRFGLRGPRLEGRERAPFQCGWELSAEPSFPRGTNSKGTEEDVHCHSSVSSTHHATLFAT